MISIICLILLFIINNINTTNLRCYEQMNGSIKLIDRCRTCVIYIDLKINQTISSKKFLLDHTYRYRRETNETAIHQKCARETDGPIYGFDQTHCYCNTNLCNSNIQRCIYEIVSKRYFSCYHGTNSTGKLLEISKKCRSCRIRKDFHSIYHYQCLTFGELEQKNDTYCTCQHPMCNQDFLTCQRFQQITSKPRLNLVHKVFLNSTRKPILITSTHNSTILILKNQTEQQETFMENSTTIQLYNGSCNDINNTKTIVIQMKSHGNFFSLNFIHFSLLYVISSFVFYTIYY